MPGGEGERRGHFGSWWAGTHGPLRQFFQQIPLSRARPCQDWPHGKQARGHVAVRHTGRVSGRSTQRRREICRKCGGHALETGLWPRSCCPAGVSRPSGCPLAGTFTKVFCHGLSTGAWVGTAYASLTDLETSWGLPRCWDTSRCPPLVLCPCPETDTQGRTGDFRSGITSSLLRTPELSQQWGSLLMALGLTVDHQQGCRATDPGAPSFPAPSSPSPPATL